MIWTPDKIAHYKRSFSWSRKGALLSLVPIIAFILAGRFSLWLILFPFIGAISVLILGAAKELIYDKLLGQGQAEWDDMKANLIGAWHGLYRKPKFK